MQKFGKEMLNICVASTLECCHILRPHRININLCFLRILDNNSFASNRFRVVEQIFDDKKVSEMDGRSEPKTYTHSFQQNFILQSKVLYKMNGKFGTVVG